MSRHVQGFISGASTYMYLTDRFGFGIVEPLLPLDRAMRISYLLNTQMTVLGEDGLTDI